jgi:hypothetical protein
MKRVLLSSLVAGMILSTSLIADNATSTKELKNTNKVAVEKERKRAEDNKTKLVQEAIDSLKYAHDALINLENSEKEKAVKNIEKALGKLEVILASKNTPSFLPVDSTITVKEYVGTKESIKHSIDLAKDLLDDNRVQYARDILNTLQSEIDVNVVSLPLASYPDALKLSASYIHDNKIEEAKHILTIALNTFENSVEIIPLPLVKASNLIYLASQEAKDNKNREKALSYLKSASDELDIAELLGYVSSSDTTYKMLHESIEKLNKEIKGKNSSEKLFSELTKKLKEFREKIFKDNEENNKK